MSGTLIEFGRFRFDVNARTLYEKEQVVALPAKAAEVLAVLVERPGEVVTKEEFLDRVWKDTFVEQRNLTQCIFLLRKAFHENETQQYIETVSKRGYRFASPVTVRSTAVAAAAAVRVAPAGERVESRREGRRAGEWPWAAVGILTVGMVGLGAAAWRGAVEIEKGVAGPLTRVTWSETASEPDISADGRFLVFADERRPGSKYAIYRVDLPEGSPYPITPLSPEPLEDPAISSDGRMVAYRASSGDGMLYMVAADGSSGPVAIPDTSRGRQPRWQPGRQAIAYWVAAEEHVADFGMVNLQTVEPAGKPIRIFDGFDTASAPVWAPGGEGLLALGTMQSAVAEREFDAWVNPFRNSISGEGAIRTGLFDLLKSRGLYATIRDRARVRVTGWREGHLYLSIYAGHAANLYRVAIGGDFRVTGEPELLTSGSALLLSPRVASNGVMVFASAGLSENPWRLSMDGERLEPVPASAGWLARHSLSADGAKLAAEVYAPNRAMAVVEADARTGASRQVAAGQVAFPVMSPDGKSIVYRVMDGRHQALEVAPSGGGKARRICEDCGAPEEWTADGKRVLYHTGAVPARIGVVKVDEAESARDWLAHPDYGLFGPRLHGTGTGEEWVAFYAENTPRTRRIYIARVEGGQAPGPEAWIPITDGKHWDSSPVWGERGESIYFVSLRDGHRCVYRQTLAAGTRQPVGEVVAVRHLHSPRMSLANFNKARGAENLRVAGGALYLILDQVSSDIWRTQMGGR